MNINKKHISVFLPFFILLFFSIFALLAAEFAVRWLFPAYSPQNHIYFVCRDGLYTGPPDTTLRQYTNTGEYDVSVHFNRYGFRDHRDIALAADSNWVVVGDSYSMGHGVRENERYSDILETLLGQTVYNISIPGDLDEYFELIKYAGSIGKPAKKIILGFCMKNDLKLYPGGEVPCGKRTDEDSGESPLQRFKLWLRKNSALYFSITSIIQQNTSLRKNLIRLGLINPPEKQPAQERYGNKILHSTLKRLREIIKSRESIILVIPFPALWLGDEQKKERKLHKTLVDSLSGLAGTVVDLKPEMELSGNPMRYYFPKDGHWNPAGHRLAAEKIAEIIKNRPEFISENSINNKKLKKY
jgi:hypothetical protein